MSAVNSTFQTPIPGSSIAHKWGSFPFSRPPKYTDPNEALEYIWKTLHKKDTLKQLWYLQEKGATSFALSRAVLYKAAMEGIIQMNLAINIYPVVGQMIDTLGKSKGIDVKTYPKFKDKLHDAMTGDTLNDIMGNKQPFQYPKSALDNNPPPKPEDAMKMYKAKQQALANAAPKQPLPSPAAPQGILAGMNNKGV